MFFIYALFGVTFGGAAIGIFFGLIMPNIADKHVAKHGTEVTATVTAVRTNTTVNGEPYYRIEFEYADQNGEIKAGRTNDAYTEREAKAIKDAGVIQIKYLNGRAVAADFKSGGATGSWFFWIFVLAFGAVGAGMTAAFWVKVARAVGYARIYRVGRDDTGTFLDGVCGMYVNGTPYNSIIFEFEDDAGIKRQIKTGADYLTWETEVLRRIRKIDIKYLGKKAIITHDITQTDKDGLLADIKNTGRGADIFAESDAVYKVLCKELDKEPDAAARSELLQSHASAIDADTYAALAEYIDTLSAAENK
jgi:hypothetical protein